MTISTFSRNVRMRSGFCPQAVQALPPCFRLLLGIGSNVQAFSLRFLGVYPWLKILPPQFGKGEKQISKVSLGIDDDGRDSIEGGFFKNGQTKTGLPAAGHPDADGVGDEITRVVEDREVAGSPRRGIVRAA